MTRGGAIRAAVLAGFLVAGTGAARAAGPAAAQEWKRSDPPEVAARRLREMEDKREFYDRALEIGGGTYLYMALEAALRCVLPGSLGMGGAEQQLAATFAGKPDAAKRLRAVQDMLFGCDRFRERPVGKIEMARLRQRIAEQPDAMGRAYALGHLGRPADREAARALARELIASDDAHVIRWVGLYLVSPKGPAAGADSAAVKRDANAWPWALCDLGMECDPQSHLGRVACFVGECGWKHIDEVGERLFTGAAGAVRRADKDALVTAVRQRDWKRLGL